jgi:hypothetical protein
MFQGEVQGSACRGAGGIRHLGRHRVRAQGDWLAFGSNGRRTSFELRFAYLGGGNPAALSKRDDPPAHDLKLVRVVGSPPTDSVRRNVCVQIESAIRPILARVAEQVEEGDEAAKGADHVRTFASVQTTPRLRS